MVSAKGSQPLAEFDLGAVAQHFTKNTGGDPGNISRVAGVDFRLPTQQELDALDAIQLSVFVPRRQEFDLEKFLTTDSQRRGRDLFFGEAKCSECHGGPVLSEASAALGGGNQAFNTGVVNLPINSGANGGFGPLPLEAGGARKFSTPPLFNIRTTAPFFHDNSVATLREAVAFYDSVQFNQSPASDSVTGVGPIGLTEAQTDDLTAFLDALADPEKIVDLRLVISQPVVRVGDSFTVAVQVEPNGQQVTGVELFLRFDPLARIHRRTSLGTALEEASGCSSESGIMVLEQKPARKQGAPNRCCHRTNPTVSASSLTTIAWWPMPACSCRPP